MAELSSSSAPKPQQSTGAMALLEKYATLNSNIERIRREQENKQQEMELVNEGIEAARLKRVEMKEERDQTKESLTALSNQITEMNSVLNARQLKRSGARSKLNEAKHAVSTTRMKAEESRQSFLDTSREFRSSCKRMRLRLQTAEHYSNDDNGQASSFRNLLLDGDKPLPASGATSAKEIDFSNDLDIQEAIKEDKSATKTRNGAIKVLEETRISHRKAVEGVEKRRGKLERIRAQLDRVRRDCSAIEKDIARLDRETRESRSMAGAYAKDADRRKRNVGDSRPIAYNNRYRPSSDRSAYPTNRYNNYTNNSHSGSNYGSAMATPSPYGNANNRATTGYHSNRNNNNAITPGSINTSRSRQSCQLKNPVSTNYASPMGASASPVVTNPYARSTAMNKRNQQSEPMNNAESQQQFQLNRSNQAPVLIQDEEEEGSGTQSNRPNSSRNMHPHRAGRIRRQRQFSTALQIMAGFDDDAQQQTSKPAAMATVSNSLSTQADDDDDDDDGDDELLSYVAFRR